MANLSIAILGLNRRTASIGLALKRYSKKGGKHQFDIIGFDTVADNLKKAKKMQAIDKTENQPENAVKNVDIVIMAVSYEETEQSYKFIRETLRDGAVILDMSPIKQPSLKWAESYLTAGHHLVGMTPILNPLYLFDSKDTIESAEEDLFDNSAILLTPSPSCAKDAVDLAFNFASILGSKPRFLDPLEHDALLSQTVQLPRLLGTALYYDLAQQANWDDLKWFTNPEFGALTRPLFDIHPDALRDEFFNNRETLSRMVDSYIETLSQFRDVLRSGDKNAVEAATVSAAQSYEKWVNNRYQADWDSDDTSIADVKAETGILQGLLGSKLADKLTGKDDND